MNHRNALVAPLLALLGVGCASPVPPAMAPASSASVPAAHEASIVFVRPDSPCDAGDYSIVVDDHGHFIGNVAPNTQMVVPVSPGAHVYYSWSSHDLRFESQPAYNPVAATRVTIAESATEYVALLAQTRESSTNRCWHYTLMDMRRVMPQDSTWNDLQDWIQSATPLVADRSAGQLALNNSPAMLQSYLELGQASLHRKDVFAERQARRDAERAAGTGQ